MKKLFLSLSFLFITIPLWAQSNREIKEILRQSEPFLWQELQSLPTLPASLTKHRYPLHLSSKNHFAVAEYVATKDKIFVFKRPLKNWLKTYAQKQHLPRRLAKCLAPVYLHELSHGRDSLVGKKHGFVWPVTTSDEYISTFWQVYLIKKKLKENPDYYRECDIFMPKKDFLEADQYQLERQILTHYSFLPPPMSEENINQLIEHKKITYLGLSFVPKRSILSSKSFFQKGGSWLEIKTKKLEELSKNHFFRLYIQEKNNQLSEISNVFYQEFAPSNAI